MPDFWPNEPQIMASLPPGWEDPQPSRLEGRYDAVIVTDIPSQDVGPHEDQPDRAAVSGRGRTRSRIDARPGLQPRVIKTDIRVIDRWLRRQGSAERRARTRRVTIHQVPNQVNQVAVAARQPVLHREEIGAQILSRAGNET